MQDTADELQQPLGSPDVGPLAGWVQLAHSLAWTPGLPVAAAMVQAVPWAQLCQGAPGAHELGQPGAHAPSSARWSAPATKLLAASHRLVSSAADFLGKTGSTLACSAAQCPRTAVQP